MSVTKDGNTGRWMSQIRVTDWTGKTIHKKKRGFTTKKEALQWERDFISQSTGSLGMTFGDFISLYVKDMEHRLKPSTVASKKWLIDLKVTPFFKKIPLNEIKPTHVRQWQNSLTIGMKTASLTPRPISSASTTSSRRFSTTQSNTMG